MVLKQFIQILIKKLKNFIRDSYRDGIVVQNRVLISVISYSLFGIQHVIIDSDCFLNFDKDKGKAFYDLFIIFGVLFMITNTIFFKFKQKFNSKVSSSIQRTFCLSNAITCLIIFLVGFEKLSSKKTILLQSPHAFFSLSNSFSISLYLSLRTQFKKRMFLIFFCVVIIINYFMYMTPASGIDAVAEGDKEGLNSKSNFRNIVVNFTCSVLVILLLLCNLFKLSKKGVSKETLLKLIQQSPTGNIILRNQTIIFKNEVINKFFGMNINITYEHLEALRFDRYIKIKDRLESPVFKESRKKTSSMRSPTMLFGRSLNLNQVIQILKRSPELNLNFYTKVARLRTGTREGNGVIRHSFNNLDDRLMTDPVMENGGFEDEQDSELVHLEMKIAHLDWANYGEEYIVLEFSDVTNAQIIKENEKENEFKLHILNSFSHELRTPLNSTKGIIDCVMEDRSVPELIKQRYLKFPQASLALLEYMILDIIDFLKIETNQLYLDLEIFSINPFLQEILNIVKVRGEERNVVVKFQALAVQERSINTDRTRLKRILINTILYCIKYTKFHLIIVSAQEYIEGKCVIIVKDEAVPISSLGEISQLSSNNELLAQPQTTFKNFDELENDFSIFVTKMLADEMKDYGLERFNCDVSREGWSFKIIVEMEKKSEQQIASDPRIYFSAEPGALTFPKTNRIQKKLFVSNFQIQEDFVKEVELKECPQILIVDDDSFNLLSMEMLLEKLGLSCLKAHNGQEALNFLLDYTSNHKCPPGFKCNGIRCIFMDLQMPVMDGIECAKKISEFVNLGQLPFITIIACTANDSKTHREQSKQAGMANFIEKPLNYYKIQKILVDLGMVARSN